MWSELITSYLQILISRATQLVSKSFAPNSLFNLFPFLQETDSGQDGGGMSILSQKLAAIS